jgi:hypothetical protein
MNHPNIKPDARQDICGDAYGDSYNCTYSQTFTGPGYQCIEVATGINDTGRLKEFDAPFNTSILVPNGNYAYYANADVGAYDRPQKVQFEKGTGGVPVGPPPADLGVFKHEPALWIGYSANSTEPLKEGDPLLMNWTHRYDPHIVRCVHMETEYAVFWNFTEPFFHSTTSRKYLHPIVATNFTLWQPGLPDDKVGAQPSNNYISPRGDVQLYKKTAAYHAMGDLLRAFLDGHIDLETPKPGPTYAQVFSDITKTRLVGKNSEPKKSLPQDIEEFYQDMILSLLSAPNMLVISSEKVSVNRTRIQSSFVYVPERLWQCYAPVIFTTLLILVFGVVTICQDGTTFSTGFSRILVTTRNETLDEISRGACLGNDPFPVELMRTRVQFGVLGERGKGGVGHCAFGVASEVGGIRKGMVYAGLKRRSGGEEGGRLLG